MKTEEYSNSLQNVLAEASWRPVEELISLLRTAWQNEKRVYICGNGGSAANAMHIANDLLYGVSMENKGLRVMALPSNSSILTCLANDLGYDEIYSRQIKVQGSKGDVLIVLSGSGNSPNVIKALSQAKEMEITTCAILGYSGGKCLELADIPIHFPVDDMQISEDMQLIVGHMVMQSLCADGK